MLFVVIPTLYWVAVIEVACLFFHISQGDLTFGQVSTYSRRLVWY